MFSSVGETGGGSGWPASRNRCRRSLDVSLSACARLSRTGAEGCTFRPCSSHTYQEVPIWASWATSSRRSPGVRRRKPGGNPTSLGDKLARRLRKKSARASRRSCFCISRCSLAWWSETYDQHTLVLLSPGEHTQGEHRRQDVTCTRARGIAPIRRKNVLPVFCIHRKRCVCLYNSVSPCRKAGTWNWQASRT